jgi:hypothetical protein
MNLLALEEKLPYIHNRVGFNYRMTEIQSAIGINELKRFDNWNLARRKNMPAFMIKLLPDWKALKNSPSIRRNDGMRIGGITFCLTWIKSILKRINSLKL